MKEIGGGVTAPAGFLAAGIHAGIKKSSIPDLALLVSPSPATVAGVFTTNRVVAAPVILDRARLRGGLAHAIIINSGNANACTGAQGLADAEEMARLVAERLDVPARGVFVGSTGVIGQPLSMSAIRRGIPLVIDALRRRGGRDAARAILTTDTRVKEAAVQARIGGRLITVGGMAKGSGMIHPNMATLLAYLTTDAAVSRQALQTCLTRAAAKTFNCISVDGDTSTNDTVLCLANGAAGNRRIETGSAQIAQFSRLIEDVCRRLARAICWDGEGVTKVVELHVTGARRVDEARQIAGTIATSMLVKTAMFGQDANWGRIIAAAGRSGVTLNAARLGLAFNGIPIVRRGKSLGTAAERRIAKVVKEDEFTLRLDLHQGTASSRVWFTDLSYEYVKINASYRS